MGNPEPLHRLPDLPAGNAGRSAVLPAHLPEDLHRSSGAAVWHEPEQSQPVDPCSAASVARGAARSRRPLPHGFGAPPGCLGGAARGRAAAGACALPSLCLQSWAGLPPFAHDGTERRIPQNPAEQTQCYSGKKKDHTVKNILLVNAVLIILFLSDTVGSMTSGLPNRIPSRPEAGCCRISASWPSPFPRWRSSCRPRNHQLPRAQQRANQALHSRRLRIEHVNSSVKRCRVVKDRIRLWKQGVRDVVMEICCITSGSA